MNEDVIAEQNVAWQEQFVELRPRYEKLCLETQRIIFESAAEENLSFQNISARAKTVDSFIKKALKISNGEAKYKDPIKEITDLAGVRIITYTLKDLEKIDRFIVGNFDIVEKRDVGEERYKEGKFGYKSIHYLVRYPKNRLSLSENKKYAGLICEIQIRTVLQHAWAEIEHDIQYKNQSDVPRSLERKFVALAGLLEIADREFQAIQDEDARLKKEIDDQLQTEVTKEAISSNDLDNTEPVANLVREKRYNDAILAYNRKIQSSPLMHTLFLGRAKAKFLSGDRMSALLDIEKALELAPADQTARKLKAQFTEGSFVDLEPGGEIDSEEDANELTRRANKYIEDGDGVSAFELYSRAQERGASRPFSQMNKAIACVISSDFRGAAHFLGALKPRIGTPMLVNLMALYCIVSAIDDLMQFDLMMAKLDEALSAVDEFNFSMSPLAKLGRGLKKAPASWSNEAKTRVELVFAKIGQNETL